MESNNIGDKRLGNNNYNKQMFQGHKVSIFSQSITAYPLKDGNPSIKFIKMSVHIRAGMAEWVMAEVILLVSYNQFWTSNKHHIVVKIPTLNV